MTVFGKVIEAGTVGYPVKGVQPDWLAGDKSPMKWTKPDGVMQRLGGPCEAKEHNFASYVHTPDTETLSFMLPEGHWAYTAIAAGLTHYAGKGEPLDWDGGDVLLANGEAWGLSVTWDLEKSNIYRVIGYRARQPTFTAAHATDATHVSVKRMTEDEAEARGELAGFGPMGRSGYVQCLRDLGLIHEPTKAERIATKTGLTVEQVQSVLNEVSE